ncbi:MAG TPA: NAD(P)H-dependent oxidoreductase [Stellaceae bacterium]|nr:NAD(P)H-dependent oxidoreductase [Stellaceae bacterium]
MQHLLIVCHPKRQSFTQTVARAYAKELASLGHDVVIRDLYRYGFDPVLSERELMGPGKLVVPAAVRREQRRLLDAGAIAFFYPLWWGHMPAMLKGYFDRVFAAGVAYDMRREGMIPRLSGKKAIIFTSSAAGMTYLRRNKQWRAVGTLEEDQILSLCGVELLEHVHFASITPDLSEKEVAKHLGTVREVTHRHWGRTPAAQG